MSWWLTPVILATQEAVIRRIEVQSQPNQIVHKTLSWKKKKKTPQKKYGWQSGSRCRPWVQTLILQKRKKRDEQNGTGLWTPSLKLNDYLIFFLSILTLSSNAPTSINIFHMLKYNRQYFSLELNLPRILLQHSRGLFILAKKLSPSTLWWLFYWILLSGPPLSPTLVF
jgi:hypothetical protein